MMQEHVRPLSENERKAFASRDYWQKVADTEANEDIRKNALHYVSMYENDIVMLEGIWKRAAEREARRNVYIPPPPLTLFEMALSPLYILQLILQGLFVAGLWTVLALITLGVLIGSGGMWAVIGFALISAVMWGKWPIIAFAFVGILISGAFF